MQFPTLEHHPAHVPTERVVDFDMYAPPGVAEDFHKAWQTLQAPDLPDIVWTPRNGGHWIATRAAVIAEVMADYERFSNRTIMIPKALGADHNLIPTTLDPPEHRPYRALLNDAMARSVIEPLEGTIRRIAIELIEDVRMKGGCNFTTDYAEAYPIRIFLSLMELPLEDAPRTKYWSDQLLRPDGSMTFEQAMKQLFDYLEPFVDERRGKNGSDMLSRLVNGKVGRRDLTNEEAMKLSAQVLIAGLDTVVNFLGFVMLHLARNPRDRAALAQDRALIPDAVEEFLRRFPIVSIGREINRDIEFHGATLKAGEMIAIPTPLAGLDDRTNENPLAVDFHRASNRHLTFGTGAHLCPGRHLARTEVRITLEEWLRRIPEFSLTPGAVITFTSGIVGVVDTLPLRWDSQATVS